MKIRIEASKYENIIRLFLNGSSLETIARMTKVDKDDVIAVLRDNKATNIKMLEILERKKKGITDPFFYKEHLGRPKLNEKEKRKVKQIRLSDKEMEQLGNPNSTQMRNMLLKLSQIESFCQMLDEKGINLIPDEWLKGQYNSRVDPFWDEAVYSSNIKRLYAITNEKCWDDVK